MNDIIEEIEALSVQAEMKVSRATSAGYDYEREFWSGKMEACHEIKIMLLEKENQNE